MKRSGGSNRSGWYPGLVVLLVALAMSVKADDQGYGLEAVSVAEGVWVVSGSTDNFSRANGGNILNTGFMETGEGVVVIDSGPSRRYGEEFRRLIERHTDEPIVKVLITHHHPDHAFGSQAFDPDTLYMLNDSARQLARDGEAFSENMYRLVGSWMRGTEVIVPAQPIQPGVLELGMRTLHMISMRGHSGADLVVLDEASGVLFASDMVFFNRALTTPHTAGFEVWGSELRQLAGLSFSVLVPGHGPILTDGRAFEQMIDYLGWLDETLKHSAAEGLSAAEVSELPIPERFAQVEGARYELVRTVSHLYAAFEKQELVISAEGGGL